MADNELFGNSEQLDCSDCVNHGGDWECDHIHCRKSMDTISRAAAIDALGERPMPWTDDDYYVLGGQNQYDSDRLAIETVPSAQRWIPCKLVNQCFIPQLEDCGMISILVTCERGTVRKKRVVKIVSVYHGRVQSKENRIIAFMPLPEPWKGEPND